MTAKSRATLNSDADTNLADNTSADISASDVRTSVKDLADSAFIKSDESNLTTLAAGGSGARNFLGLGTSDEPQFATIQVGHATDTTLARSAAGKLSVEGVDLIRTSDVASTSAAGISEFATSGEYRTGTDTGRALVVDQVWAAALNATLTDGANIAVDLSAGFNFGGSSSNPLNIGGNRNLSAPSNVKGGQSGIAWFGATGSTRTLTPNAAWNLLDGVEVGPYSITTSQTLGIAYVTRGTTVFVTAILRIG
jgi:hypothetical protein